MSHTERLEFTIPRKQMLNAHGNSQWKSKMSIVKRLRTMGYDQAAAISEDRAAHDGTAVHFDKFEITVTLKPPIRNRIDPANYYPTAKALIDGLTDAGWWEDDNFEHLLEVRFRYGGLAGVTTPDPENPEKEIRDKAMFRLILDIREIEDTSGYILKKEYID